MIVVKNIPGKGRGVITTDRISNGIPVEWCPVIPVKLSDIAGTTLDNYAFKFGEDHCICLGRGSLFNHSRTPNLAIERMVETQQILFYAARDIKAGEELTIDYGWELENFIV